MANSILVLYNTEITPDRNCKVDKLESYLDNCEKMNIGPFQYQKLGLNMTIKIKADQSLVGNKQYNYAAIYQDDRTYYFFIDSASWVARKTVALNLVMDTINTWWDDLKWNGKTTISRQHMDRWLGMDGSSLRNRIDHYNEGFNPTLNNAQKEELIEGTRCYVVYKTRDGITQDNTINPISAAVYYDEAKVISTQKNNPIRTLGPTWDTGSYYFITSTGTKNASLRVAATTPYTITFDSYSDSRNAYLRAVRIEPTTGGMTLKKMWYSGDTYPYAYQGMTEEFAPYNATITLNNIREYHITPDTDEYANIRLLNVIDGLEERVVVNSGLIPAQITTPFSLLDRSNSLFMKIVQVPYDLVDGKWNGQTGVFELHNGWTFNPGWGGIETDLTDRFFTADIATIEPTEIFYTTIASSPNINDEFKGAALEPKLWSSEFTNVFLNFDAETIQIKPERITKINRVPAFDIKFALSNAISSDMMFKIDWNVGYIKESKYDGTMISARNMEKPIYNNNYVDYLRNGYNWDQATLKRQNQTARVNTVLGVGGGLVQAGIGLTSPLRRLRKASRNLQAALEDHAMLAKEYSTFRSMPNVVDSQAGYDYEELRESVLWASGEVNRGQAQVASVKAEFGGSGFAGLVAGQVLNSFQSAYNAARSIESNNQNFQSSLANKQAQASGIEGSSNVDLFTQYSDGAHLEYNIYGLRQEDKENLARVFYYTGYAHPVQEIPNFDSRSWFNFVQCDPVFDDEATNIYNNYVDDIKNRFKIGITVYHNNNDKYDFNQTKENWETNILNA